MEKLRAESFAILNFPFSISKWGRNGFDGGVEAGIAVSYTHLDVYKRQLQVKLTWMNKNGVTGYNK